MKTKKIIYLFLLPLVIAFMSTTCTKETPPVPPKPIKPTIPLHDALLEGRTWKFFAFGNDDSTHLVLPADTLAYSLVLDSNTFVSEILGDSITGQYTLYTGSKIQFNTVNGNNTTNTNYSNAIKAITKAQKYTIARETLKLYHTEKEYLIFIEQNNTNLKRLSFKWLLCFPFNLEIGKQVIIDSQEKFLKYFQNDPIGYTFWLYNTCGTEPEKLYFDIDSKVPIDFSKYSIIAGAWIADMQPNNTEQFFFHLGGTTYYYHIKTFNTFDIGKTKFHYGIVVDKLPENATVIFDLKVL